MDSEKPQLDQKKAQKYIKDPKLAFKLAQKAAELYQKNKTRFKEVKADLLTMIRLVKAWATKKYTQVRVSTITWIILTLIYFINPFDIVPDFLLKVGFLDDITMITLVVGAFKQELDDFKVWEEEEGKKNP